MRYAQEIGTKPFIMYMTMNDNIYLMPLEAEMLNKLARIKGKMYDINPDKAMRLVYIDPESGKITYQDVLVFVSGSVHPQNAKSLWAHYLIGYVEDKVNLIDSLRTMKVYLEVFALRKAKNERERELIYKEIQKIEEEINKIVSDWAEKNEEKLGTMVAKDENIKLGSQVIPPTSAKHLDKETKDLDDDLINQLLGDFEEKE